MADKEEQRNPDLDKLTLSTYLPSMGVLSGFVVFVCTALYLLLPQLYQEQKITYSVGDVSMHHSFTNLTCAQCHTTSFQKITDNSCGGCHKLSPHMKHEKEGQCIECHTEHKGEVILREDRQCTTCHADIMKGRSDFDLKNVTSWKNHPEFRTPPDKATLHLNHAIHLKKGLQGNNGPEDLECASCHKMDARDEKMSPINYENNCARCHTLEFDERAPAEQVPHGDVKNALVHMQGVYARMALTGKIKITKGDEDRLKESVTIRSPEFIDAAIWKEVRGAEDVIFTKTGCILCHQVTKNEVDPTSKEPAYTVEKVSVNSVWMPKAHFAHSAHQQLTCESCHGDVKSSKESTDKLMPKVENCAGCHSQSKELSNCITCHSYHDPIPLERLKQKSAAQLLGTQLK